MTKSKQKKSSQGLTCPLCDSISTPETMAQEGQEGNKLRLETASGNYVCHEGHQFTQEQLRSVLSCSERQLESPNDSSAALEQSGQIENLPTQAAQEVALDGSDAVVGHDSIPRTKINANFTDLAQDQDKQTVGAAQASSQKWDEMAIFNAWVKSERSRLLPNGDLPVGVVIPENMVEPVIELAGQDKKTVAEWLSEVVIFTLEDYFSAARR